MLRFRNYLPFIGAAVVGVAVLGATTPAHATLQLSWSVNNTLLGSDATNTSFAINTGSVGGFSVTGSALGTNSGVVPPGVAGMDLSTVSITSTGPSTLTLYLTQNNLTSPVGLGTLTGTLTGHFISGTGTVSMVSYGNDTNLLYGNATGQAGTSPSVSPPNNVATAPFGLGGTASVNFNAISPYSMTEILTINFTSAGTVSLSSDGSTTFANPEPSTLALAATALPLLGIGMVLRRRRAQA